MIHLYGSTCCQVIKINRSDRTTTKFINCTANSSDKLMEDKEAMHKSESLETSFINAEANTGLVYVPLSLSIGLLATVRFQQTNEKLVYDEMNGMNDFGGPHLVELV